MIELYECDKCGWIGKEPKELAGYLLDYTMHDACPVCWEKDTEDNMVEISYYAYTPIEHRHLNGAP